MTLPASGPISFNAINVELGVTGTTQANINQASYRTLAGVPSGAISLSNFYGKSNRVTITLTISGDTANYNVYNNRGGSYIAGISDIIVNVNSGVYVYSNSTGTAGMIVSGFAAGDTVRINNSGFIVGRGGNGGNGANFGSSGFAGGSGGTALQVSFATSVNNTGTVGGGGGGGGGSGGYNNEDGNEGGSGGGGGRGNGPGGSAGGGTNAGAINNRPGAAGTLTSPGAGGASDSPWNQIGGTGGQYGASGSSGSPGAPFGGTTGGGGGGASGSATSGNSNITWIATGTRLGPLN